MAPTRIFAGLARVSARRPLVVLLAVAALALAGAALALGLQPTAGTNTLVSTSSGAYQATQRYHQRFGDDPVIVLVRGDLQRIVLSRDVERLLGLEGCLSGNAPAGVTPPGGPNGPCAALAREKQAQIVFGPGTFINQAVVQLSDQFSRQTALYNQRAAAAARAAYLLALGRGYGRPRALRVAAEARALVLQQYRRNIVLLGIRYGLTGLPALNDPNFVATVVFDPTKPVGTPKARFAYLFPTRDSAVIQVRLKPNLSDAQRTHAIGLIRAAVQMPDWHLQNGSYTVTGVPVVVSDLTSSITNSVKLLLVAALIVMALTLRLAFRSRLRLLPLAIALVAAALTFGGLALTGEPLTVASIGVVPVLIGLAVDYAIQFQSRFNETRARGEPAPRAVPRAAALGAPTIAAAGAATVGGLAVVALPVIGSPVPMVRGFAALLIVGVVLAFVCALTAGSAVLALSDGGRERGRVARALRPAVAAFGAALARARDALAPAWRGAGELLSDNRPARAARAYWDAARARLAALARASMRTATERPTRVLGIALALAALGWVLDTQTRVESNIQKLVPQSSSALRNLDQLQRATGVGGEIDVTVAAADLTDPRVIGWMSAYQQGLLSRFGYTPAHGCGAAQLCPAFSLPTLFAANTQALTRADIVGLLNAVPRYFSQGVITPDRRVATLAFGIRLMPLDQQQHVIDVMRQQLHPPPGVHAELAGLTVLAAEANTRISAPWRRIVTLLAGLAAVGLVLLAAFRRPRRALTPLVPIALATGWSALLLFAIRIPLNPLSITLGALVIAISTEFSVLLAERYRQERVAGRDPPEALRLTYRHTGAAVLASGVTAIAGFGVLVFSDIRMLRDFGFVTVIDLAVALLGVMLVLPSVLVLAERGELVGLPARLVREALRAGPRLRRARGRAAA